MANGWNLTLEELQATEQGITQMQNSLAIEYDRMLRTELSKKRRSYIKDCYRYAALHPNEQLD